MKGRRKKLKTLEFLFNKLQEDIYKELRKEFEDLCLNWKEIFKKKETKVWKLDNEVNHTSTLDRKPMTKTTSGLNIPTYFKMWIYYVEKGCGNQTITGILEAMEWSHK